MFESLYKELLNKINAGNRSMVLTYLDFHDNNRGSISKKILLAKKDLEKKSFIFDEDVYKIVLNSFSTGKVNTITIDKNKSILVEPFFPKPRLIIFGGGHIAKPLVEFSSRVGFSITVVDDRFSFANEARFPEAERVICEPFSKSFDLIDFRECDFVVIITRGHKHDEMILRKILNYDVNYVGMIGSRGKVKGILDRLLREGFPKNKIDSVNSPIGLDIAAITPDEIAISILSQLISFKNKDVIKKLGKDFDFPELDKDIAKELSKESKIPKAILTILSSKGSVPRKAGAKMLVDFNGNTLGTIGGGCSEATAIANSKKVILDKGFLIEHFDMTGYRAESEGMVCGGTMDVLIESF
ncbi:XdhC family protein [Clostridium tetani]|uniref:Xanthine dehydrogenase n=1 Tax=Clostridium tetani TaxID=1513 RepID=A0ABY0ENF1_CLOTA|nr:XdhC/CoxI family protein [Clostridium tetani]CDI50018.1 alcohol dehydrogenase [Clostridium tetani 12124569]KHO38527.1 xanthine dehydrogenase [Clostridium tetani]RXI40082.1 xanthine dehydrogenase [Clostridium tetani]RXI54908.1 xanthine dehydrogenase [Clostridium tetani]RXI71770.1 xanthine dehydrogenase [Clostridium tetani]